MPKPVGPFVNVARSSAPGRPIRASDRSSRASRANKAKGAHRSSPPRRLGERLQSAKAVAKALPAGGRDYAYATASVGPELKLWAVPQGGEEHLSRMGLSIPLNSQNRSRPGISGISVYGRKTIERSCRLLDDLRAVSYTHLTLPTILLV